ncbi:uncharacterized protein A1O9_11644 [Exophiala aquamarina CBS 119918]|uniref:CENP-V/GFA domain-containing protein n=1 Tax=Exophiala aquamarina CBS 119918 TaxID=1182545 RepID=A0A072NZF2_9EURO|nr:uncharacterized protein A1O9_11644 [Exophiala aquamarina CBS 119918]KEF52403.1 hypothetical protein A1O9_11644 [Exophiala aquamarina CBS 119918]
MALTATHLQCHCAAVYEPATLLKDETLPLKNDMCHCSMCRFSTGSLAAWFAGLKRSPSDKSMSSVTAYNATKTATRYFCNTCGCNVFVHMMEEGRWLACAGIVEVCVNEQKGGGDSSNEGKVLGKEDLKEDRYGKEERVLSNPRYHEYVGSAADGGLAPYMMKLGGRDIPSYTTEPGIDGDKTLDPADVLALRTNANVSPSARGSSIQVACICGGVELRIAPPPYNDTSEGWYVTSDKSKYYARLCNCRSCRLTLGFPFQPWTYIPPSRLFTTAGDQLIVGPKAKDTKQIQKLKYYQSSESVLRGFCEGCGATMFYQSFDRPYIINVCAGVARSKVGNVMLGEWLQWDRKVVSKREEAVEEEMIEAWLRA